MLILQVYMLLFQNRKFIDVAKIPYKSQNVINVETFCKISSDKFFTVGILVHNFWSQGSIDTLAFLQTVLFWQIAVMFALFAYVCLLNDSI